MRYDLQEVSQDLIGWVIKTIFRHESKKPFFKGVVIFDFGSPFV